MKKISIFVLFALLSAFAPRTWAQEQPTVSTDLEVLISYETLVAESETTLKQASFYKFNYETVDANGNPLVLSSALIAPREVTQTIGAVYMNCHFTITNNLEAPTSWTIPWLKQSLGTRFHALLTRYLAVPDYEFEGNSDMPYGLVIAPDYEGFGVSSDRPQSYLAQELTARHVLDATTKGLELYNKLVAAGTAPRLSNNWHSYALGLSQGGAVALAVQRYIEQNNLNDQFNYSGTLCIEGPYDLVTTLKYYLEDNGSSYGYGTDHRAGQATMPVVIPMIIQGMLVGDPSLSGYQMSDFLSQKFLDTGIMDWLAAKNKTTDDIAETWYNQLRDGFTASNGTSYTHEDMASLFIGKTTSSLLGNSNFVYANLNEVFTPNFYAYLSTAGIFDNVPEVPEANDPQRAYKLMHRAIAAQDLCTGWTPQHKIQFWHSRKDMVVPFGNYLAFKEAQPSGENSIYRLKDVSDYGDHVAVCSMFLGFEYVHFNTTFEWILWQNHQPITIPENGSWTENFALADWPYYNTQNGNYNLFSEYPYNGWLVPYTIEADNGTISPRLWYNGEGNNRHISMKEGSGDTKRDQIVALPVFTNPLNTLSIQFKSKLNQNGNRTLKIGYYDTSTGTFTALESVSVNSTNYQQYGPYFLGNNANVPTEYNDNYRLAFMLPANANGYSCDVQDIVIAYNTTLTEIASESDWGAFCQAVNSGHSCYSGETVRLTADISVSTMVGSSETNSFQGIFLGNGHTLTVSYNTSEDYTAPFRYVKNATIRNLKVAGNIYTSERFAAGLVGKANGTTSITGCHVSTVIHSSYSSYGIHGGIVADPESWSTLTIEGCAYTGRLLTNSGTSDCGGFVGAGTGAYVSVSNSIYAPNGSIPSGWSAINSGATFVGDRIATLTRCYYTEPMGTAHGTQAYALATAPANLGDLVHDYGMLTAYANGILYNGTYYVSSTGTISRTIAGYGESTGKDHWAFIASPVAGSIEATTVGNIFSATEYDLYRFNPSAELEWENWKQVDDDNYHNYHFNLVNGRGYLYGTKEDATLVFSGTFNMDDTKTIEGLPEGFNLVGNPFTVDAYVNKPYYTLNEDGSAVLSTASNAAIAPCHGVFVQVDENESVTFSTTAPTQQNAANNGSLQIALSQANTRGNAMMDNAIVSFGEGQQLGKFRFGRQNANIYIPQGGKDYAIAYSEGHGEMPLNFKANENGTYTLTVNPEGVEMDYLHLIDNMTSADVDLLADASTGSATYTFTAKKTDYESRFKLVFVAKTASGDACELGFAFISDGNIIVNGEGTLQIVDMTGRVVVSRTGDAMNRVSTNGMVPGVYVLRLINGDDVKTQKIVVR